jgi:hypothetical protein
MTETARRIPPQRQSRRRPAESFSQRSSPPKRHATYCRAGTAASRPRASCGRAGGRRLDGPHCARTEVAFDAWATARFRTFRSGGSSASTLRVITGNAGVPRARLPNAQPLADVPIFGPIWANVHPRSETVRRTPRRDGPGLQSSEAQSCLPELLCAFRAREAGWIRRPEAPDGGGVARRRSGIRAPPTPAVPD